METPHQKHSHKYRQAQVLPDAPVNLTSSNVTSTSVDLSWDAVSQADGYKVYQDGVEVGAPTTNSYSVTGLTTATSYDFYVVATNENGDSGQSNIVSVTTS